MASFAKSVAAGVLIVVISSIVIEQCRKKGWV